MGKTLADEVAACASAGWITTLRGRNEFTRTWRVTPEGLTVLNRYLRRKESHHGDRED